MPSGRSTSREQLIDYLERTYDGMRPVRIFALGYGADADMEVLRSISDITGGFAYQGVTEAQVARLIGSALATM